MLAAVKSLLAFGHRIGILRFDVGRALRLPKVPNDLAARILDEESILRMITLETHKRNAAMLRLLYVAGLRVSELCGLSWRDLQPRGEAGQVIVTGKGSKTRSVLLTAACWRVLMDLRSDAPADGPVFRSQKSGGICPSWVARIVRKAARRAGIELNVSPHWCRHAHASHSMDRGAPVHLVAATLGHSSVATTSRYLHARPDQSSSTYLAV
jgi:integrase/recombinase XerD